MKVVATLTIGPVTHFVHCTLGSSKANLFFRKGPQQ